ncbi:PREDICTED: uncharacterized protein LOC107091001 [Cyprinodon variegatus]|uniref:uncharacterized protein LOC107091001 n=1 Tax=Cyprinodon variegatus TaxID=28743 RepID=UPI0007429BCB|nr:PREDICTED: uncharacterized protein LOC107091001 [Cyprinodon variegatus]
MDQSEDREGREPEDQSKAQRVDQQNSEVPRGPSAQQHQIQLDSTFMLLEENIVTFVKKELKKIQKILSPDHPESSEDIWENEDELEAEDKELSSCREALMKITLKFLRKMKQEELAEHLQSKHLSLVCQHKLKANLKKRFQSVFEGIGKAGSSTLLSQIYSELYITEAGAGEVNDEHEVRQIDAASRKPNRPETTIRQEDIFKDLPGRDQPIRTVITKGVAGIGKTVLTQKFTLDWAEGKAHPANQIPPQCVGMVTEVRGFTDPQKEEYFRKRFRDEEKASRIISHIKTSRSVQIMCHIPVFCWISATVLEDLLKTQNHGELPSTLTEMYIHFLVVQTKVKKVMYDGGDETDPPWNPESREMIESLGKLAFDQLQKENLIFYESDLTDCGIDIRAASVYSGVFTQIFREEKGLYQQKVFCFVHLSVQEFLAALHVHLTFIKYGRNLMKEQTNTPIRFKRSKRANRKSLYQNAVDQALQSPNGHLDLFLRFLLGLSLPTNQRLLQGLLTKTAGSSLSSQGIVQYIKDKINKNLSAEKSINLFHCLNELNDRSLVKEIQQSLRSGSLSTDKLSPAQWSALAFILVTSGEDLDVFDLKKYSASEEALLRLLPVVKASNKVLCQIVEQNRFEAIRKYFSMASPNSSHARVFASTTSRATRHFDCWYMSAASGVPQPQLRLAASTIETWNMVYSDSMSSTSLGLTGVLPHHRSQLTNRYWSVESSAPLFTRVSKTYGQREPDGVRWLKPGLRKYSCQLTIDTNTVNRKLKLSEDNRKVTEVEELQSYPDHQDRFDLCPQLLCCGGLTGCCYWEVERSGRVYISVSYKKIRRKGDSEDCYFGWNDHSWSLSCSKENGYAVYHNKKKTFKSSSPVSNRVAVYVDHPAGILSFYSVSSDSLIHLFTFNITFTEPLYSGFWISSGSSVFLC